METNLMEKLLPDGGCCAIFRRIGCIGDSLASGELESRMNGVPGFHDCYEYSWGQFMARACGSVAYNFSRGGLTAKAFVENVKDEQLNILDPARKCQAYVIALGCNDVSKVMMGQLTLGATADVHPDAPDENAPTYAGYMGKILSWVKQSEPKARIFLVTLPRDGQDSPRAALEDEHAALLHQMAELFPFTYVIDLRRHGPVYDETFKKIYYLGGHLNPMGYLLTAKMFLTCIDAIIRSKPEEFAQVGFIGMEGDLHHEEYCW